MNTPSLCSQVMLCVHKQTNILYAMKVVPKAKIKTQKQINQILSELKILKSVYVYTFVCVSIHNHMRENRNHRKH